MTEQQVRSVLEAVEEVGNRFTDPDDDWMPTLMLFRQQSKNIFMMPDMTPMVKVALPYYIADLIQEVRPEYAAIVLSTWQVKTRQDSPMHDTSTEMIARFGARNHPDRIEVIVVQLADKQSNQMWCAEIKRYPDKPPTLDIWEEMVPETMDMLSGAFKTL